MTSTEGKQLTPELVGIAVVVDSAAAVVATDDDAPAPLADAEALGDATTEV